MTRSVLSISLLAIGFAVHVTAVSPQSLSREAVGRSSSDRDSDLIAALIRAGRYDDGLKVCETASRGAASQGDAIAKWAILKSKILTARQMGREQFGEADIKSAQVPVSDLLVAYGNHRRQLFLEAQMIAVQHSAAVHSVLQVSVSRSDEASKEISLRRLLTAVSETLELARRSADRRAEIDSNAKSRDDGLVADLVRLQQELRVGAVSLAIMQTELFAPGSHDRIAAATKAEQNANHAITKLPLGTPARQEVQRLKVEAIFRASQLDRADVEVQNLARSYLPSVPPRVQALQVRLDVQQQRMQKADKRLQDFYGSSPVSAPPSIDMDLARLEFLMRGDRASEIGAWLDVIEKRGGAFARRRAEAVSLASIRRGKGPQHVDPSIVAAQGQDWLRRGNPARAGDLLAEAADAESDPNRSIQWATQAAAALISADRNLDAANVLVKVTVANSRGTKAAATHLQAALLISNVNSTLPDAGANIETLLRENLQRWPASEVASSARTWLVKILTNKRQLIEAAQIATSVSVEHAKKIEIEHAIDLWQQAFLSDASNPRADVTQRFIESFEPLLSRDDLRAAYVSAAVFVFDRELLDGLPPIAEGDFDSFANQILNFRRTFNVGATIEAPVGSVREVVTWRLMRDGRQSPQHRRAIAVLLQSWDKEPGDSVERAQRFLWMGQTDQAIVMLKGLPNESTGAATGIGEAANLLAGSDARSAKEAAIEFWDQLAAGTPQGTPPWHEAKLGAIRVLRSLGKKGESQQRAKYILLTTAGIPSGLKKQYEELAR